MMDDYLFDGLGPSPEALQAWDESRAAREAAEQERAPPTLEEQLEHEKARAAALEDELKAARGETLDANGFDKVRIVASSGFGPDKCRMFSFAKAPVDVIGTGSFLPQIWSETYATADIISYNGNPCVKSGREFLLRK